MHSEALLRHDDEELLHLFMLQHLVNPSMKLASIALKALVAVHHPLARQDEVAILAVPILTYALLRKVAHRLFRSNNKILPVDHGSMGFPEVDMDRLPLYISHGFKRLSKEVGKLSNDFWKLSQGLDATCTRQKSKA